MIDNRYKPELITGKIYRLGTPSYPVYLSLGDDAMLIEGGIGAIYPLIVDQLNQLKIQPERIKYIAITHTHSDHIGAVPYLKNLWPHLQVIAGQKAAELLKNENIIRDHLMMEQTRTKILLAKKEVTGPIHLIENPEFNVDIIVKEGDEIDLGGGVNWKVYSTPGHSPCHLSYFETGEKIVSIGDATGFYVPDKDTIWPNYFISLEDYCNSIRKLCALLPQIGVLSHNYILRGGVGQYLKKAMKATEAYHREMLKRMDAGEDPEEIAMEKAKWVNTLTDEHPFEIMFTLSKVLIRRSLAVGDKKGLFDIPQTAMIK